MSHHHHRRNLVGRSPAEQHLRRAETAIHVAQDLLEKDPQAARERLENALAELRALNPYVVDVWPTNQEGES